MNEENETGIVLIVGIICFTVIIVSLTLTRADGQTRLANECLSKHEIVLQDMTFTCTRKEAP